MCRIPITGSHSSRCLHIRTRLGFSDGRVVANGDRSLRIYEFNSIDFMIGSKSISKGSSLPLPKASKYAIKPANSLGKLHQSRRLECGFTD